jgi:hypothetical protein
MGQNQKIPVWGDVWDAKFQAVYKYLWPVSEFDFCYSLELSSSFYRIRDINKILTDANYNNPNDLEWQFYLRLYEYANVLPYLLCYDQSVAFCMPMNKVQNVNNNRVGKDEEYSPENLLEYFNAGHRIDCEQFRSFVPNACHVEYYFLRGLSNEPED